MSTETVRMTSVDTTAQPTERVLGFSDALFGIAITFLALDLGEVPESVADRQASVTSFLAAHVSDYAVYVGTFVVVGFLWSRHHQMFRFIKGRSSLLVLLNLFLLALVAMLPYPAGIAGRGLGLGLALACLLVPLLVIAVLLAVLWELAVLQQLVIPGLCAQTRSSFRASGLGVVGVLSLGLLLALLSSRIDSSALCYVAIVGTGVLLVVVPSIVRLRWPTPEQASYTPANSEELDREEREEAVRVTTLLERIRNGSDTARLCVFTDGVFAIAVTVLALQLQPPARGVTLTNEVILENLNTVPWVTYLTTFAFIGIYWITHVHTFELVKGTDSVLTWLNLLFLLFVAVLPLPTELVHVVGDSPSAWVFYFAMLFFVCVFLAAMRIYSARTVKLTLERELPAEARYSIARTVWAGGAFLAGIVLVTVFDNPGYGNVVLLLIIVRGPVLRRFFPGAQHKMWAKRSDSDGDGADSASAGTAR